MAEFVYNIIKNAYITHISFEFKFNYYTYISSKDEINPRLKSRLAKKLSTGLKNIMLIY